jgi:Lrp/AsnC family transcriptional regulator, leucine-responsive regulatory protein
MELDNVDRHILSILQEDCTLQLARIGERVGLSAPSVADRIKKLEESGVIRGYTAVLDARKLGKDITAFIGVFVDHPKLIKTFEKEIDRMEAVQECHHVTGEHTVLLKVKVDNTSVLEELIRRIRSIDGVIRTETSIVLSTYTEGLWLDLKERPKPVESEKSHKGHGETVVSLKLRRGS